MSEQHEIHESYMERLRAAASLVEQPDIIEDIFKEERFGILEKRCVLFSRICDLGLDPEASYKHRTVEELLGNPPPADSQDLFMYYLPNIWE